MLVNFNSTVGNIAEAAKGKIIAGDASMQINSITTDSRMPGQNSLFVPLKGEKYDGHKFIPEIVTLPEISGFLTMDKEYGKIAKQNRKCAVICNNTADAYAAIAGWHRNKMNAFIIGITGTNGKTTTKEILWSVLERQAKTLKNERNYNNEIGVPYTLLHLENDHRYAAIEMGMNHSGEIDRLSRIVKPDIAIITNVGEGHLEFFGTVEKVAIAKSEIMNGMKKGSLIFLNSESRCIDILREKAEEAGLIVKTFGLKNADFCPDDYDFNGFGIKLIVEGELYEIRAYGIHNIYNALGVMALAKELKIDRQVVKKALYDYQNVEKRSQVINRGFIVINDTYNANPLSVRYAIESLVKAFPERRKIAVLSDMKELGEKSGYYHNELGKQVFELGTDVVCAWGEMAYDIIKGARAAGMDDDHTLIFETKQELINYIKRTVSDNDAVLVKGSRSMKMEEVVDAVIH